MTVTIIHDKKKEKVTIIFQVHEIAFLSECNNAWEKNANLHKYR